MARPEAWRRVRHGLEAAGGEGGVALAMALIVLVVLSTLAAAVLAIGTNETAISTNLVRTAQALYLAEAGIEAAFAWINVDATSNLNGAPSALTTMPVASPTGTLATLGSYTVRYRSVGANTVEVVATGTTSNSAFGRATRTVRAHMTNNYSAVDAVRSEQNGTIGGNATIAGRCGSVHSNHDVAFNGTSFTVSANVTAVGAVPDTGGAVGGARLDGVPARPLPPISPPTFLTNSVPSYVTTAVSLYELLADGRIYRTVRNADATTTRTLMTTTPLGNNDEWNGWQYKTSPSVQWATHDTRVALGLPPDNAIYYIEGQAQITNTGSGSWDTAWHASVIATGGIDISGHPTIESVIPELILMSGGTISMSGNPTLSHGAVAAQGDVTVTGNVSLTGSIVTRGTADIRGSTTITYDCGGHPPLTAALQVISWGH